MTKVKQISLTILAVLVIFGLVFTAMNLADGPQPHFDAGDDLDYSSYEAFAASVTGPPNFDKSNGFYRLWSLTEPLGTDIEADELLLRYRRMHDTQYDTEKFSKEWHNDPNNWKAGEKYTGPYSKLTKKRREILKKYGVFDSAPRKIGRDWAQFVMEKKEGVLELQQLFQPYLERYDKFVESTVIEEFTLPLNYSSIPNLLAWLQLGRLYITSHILNVMEEGSWQQSADAILAHMEACKKALRGSRTLIVSLIGKALMKESLYGLASLMNQPECPESFYQRVIRGMPVLQYEEFGTRVPLLLEGYHMTQAKDNSLLYHKNRTRQYFFDLLAHLVKCDATPAYQWKIHPLEFKPKDGTLWWMQNPEGKKAYEKFLDSKTLINLFVTTYKSWSVKAVYDMTRISAELHLNYTEGKTVQQVLDSLGTYKDWLDHGSGMPYKWHDKKQILYSFGIDTRDNNGDVDLKSYNTDIILPVAVFIK